MKILLDSEWVESIAGYPPEVRLEVYEAVINYTVSGTLPNLKPMSAGAFAFIKKEIDKAKNISAKRSVAGKKSAEKRFCLNKSEQNSTKFNKNSGDPNIDNNLNTNDLSNNLSLKEKEEITKKEIQKKEGDKKKDPRAVFVESLPDDWREVVEYWLRYKSQRRETYKTKQSLEIFYKTLLRDSEQNINTAREMIEQSIGNNWAGVFPLKAKPTIRKTKSTFVPLPTYEDYVKDGGFQV